MTGWTRPTERNRDEDRSTLHEGIPPWLRKSIWDWLDRRYQVRGYSLETYDTAALRMLELRLQRSPFEWKAGGDSAMRSIRDLVYGPSLPEQEVGLDAIHLTLHGSLGDVDVKPEVLEFVLEEGGSAWRVIERHDVLGLERRVGATAQAAAEAAMATPGNAGKLLTVAWSQAFGRTPNPTAAYHDAVRAVEAAAQEVVIPDNASATLGTILRAMEAKPEKWTCTLAPKEGVPDPVTVVIDMMRLLWRSQRARHGSPRGGTVEMTQAEAESAVHLAVTLVQWFGSGTVRMR